MRLIRPEVVITWLPDFVAGENHSDHQAAGVLATEAFDACGDALVFPAQVTPPLDHRGYGNLTEGLQAWQPKKLYYFSDAANLDFLKGAGPMYLTTDLSPARAVPYYRLVAEEVSHHLTQTGASARKALAEGDFHSYQQPVQLVLGKSNVEASVMGDVFEGVRPEPIAFAQARGYRPESHQDLWVELGSPWRFYRQFWSAHNIEHLGRLHPPETGLIGGRLLRVPLLLHNDTDQSKEISLTVDLPRGWKEVRSPVRYPVRAHDVYPLVADYVSPRTSSAEWQLLTWHAAVAGVSPSTVSLRCFIAPSGSSLRPAGEPGP
jgi:hypothetical protein